MVRLAVIPAALVLALAAGGCSVGGSSTASNGGFTGTRGEVAQTLNTFSSDASSNNATDICANVLGKAALARIAKIGTCKTIITNQLKTIDDFTLTVESIDLHGATATAHVQTPRNGTKVTQPITLRRETAGWRIDSLG